MRFWIFGGLLLALLAAWLPAHPAMANTDALTDALCTNAISPGEQKIELRSSDFPRSYLLYIPPGYDPANPPPLMMSLHGFTSTSEQQRDITALNALADEAGFIVVYPQGAGFIPRWNNGTGRFQPLDSPIDVIFFDDLLADLAGRACFDADRIYVTGFSAGGGMAHRLACERADRVAGIGTVAAAISDLPDGCNPDRPMPLIHFHGSEDRIVPIEGEQNFLPAIDAWLAEWSARNGCTSMMERPSAGDVRLTEYAGCAGDVTMQYYVIVGGGHTWPGSPVITDAPALGLTTDAISASRAMWEFLSQFDLNGRVENGE